jgi:predicted transcriptional regulator of viral defense system
MTKIDAFQLRKAIPREEFDYTLLTSALKEYSGVRQKINELLKAGMIVRVKKGLYIFGPRYNNAPVCKETLANLIYGPSCISLEYALAYHGLIPERVESIESVSPKRDKRFTTPIGRFNYRYLGVDKYPHGIDQVWIDKQHPVLMASPEKALCDYIHLNRIPDFSTGEEAREFVESDLRIDSDKLSQLQPENLRRLNKHYRSKNIERILEIL